MKKSSTLWWGSRLTLLVAAGGMAGAQAVAASPDPAEIVQRVAGAPGHTVWQITNPRVNQARTDYPQITFTKGSTVTVTAGGCVQRGGKGLTWYRYVDPAGEDSDKMYFGLISIPGATNGLERFLPTQPTVYTIPANVGLPADQMHLALGYVDRDANAYSDNGYTSHDNGPLNQCWNVGDASVMVDIAAIAPVPATPAEIDYDFTLDSATIRNLRSRKDESDTDVVGVGVVINGTQSAVGQQAIGDLKLGTHPLNVPILLEQVRPGDRFDIIYTVINAGSDNAQTIDAAITDVVNKAASSIPGAGQFVSLAAQAVEELIKLSDPDCDGVVVAGSVLGTAQDLALWTAAGPYTRTLSFPGTNSANGCGSNSFYEVTYTISRSQSSVIHPYVVKYNFPTKKATLLK